MKPYIERPIQCITALTRLILAGFLVICFTASDGYAPTAVEFNTEKNQKGGAAGSGKSGRSYWRKVDSLKSAGSRATSKFSENPALTQDMKNINRRAQNPAGTWAVTTQSLTTNRGRNENAFEAGALTTTTGKKIPEMLPGGGNTRDMSSGLSGAGLLPGTNPTGQTWSSGWLPDTNPAGQTTDSTLNSMMNTTMGVRSSANRPAGMATSSGSSDSLGLMDSMREKRRQEREQSMSTDPTSHFPDEAKDSLSPRANRIEQTSSTPLVVDDDSSGGGGGTGTEDSTSDSKTQDSSAQEPANQRERGSDSDAREPENESKEPSLSHPDNSRDEPADPRHDEERREEDYTLDDTMAPEINPLPDDAGGPLPPWAVPIAKALEKMEDRVRGTRINPTDKSPWVNPGPEGSSDQGDLGSRRMDPITPLINPNPEDQGSGGGDEGDRRVNDPNYGHVDPSPDAEDDTPASGTDPH